MAEASSAHRDPPSTLDRRAFLIGMLGAASALAGIVAGIPSGSRAAYAATAATGGSPAPNGIVPLATVINPWTARHDLTEAAYRAEFDKLVKSGGHRLVDLCGYQVGNAARYAAIWEKPPGDHPAQWSRHEVAAKDYPAVFEERRSLGYRPVRLNGYNLAGAVLYATIWEKRDGPDWWTNHDIPDAELRTEFDRLDREGYRLVDVSGFPGPSFTSARFAAIWEKAEGRHWGWIPPRVTEHYQADFKKAVAQGYHPVRVSGFLYSGNNPAYFTAVLEKSDDRLFVARHGISAAAYQHEVDHQKMSYRPVSVGAFTGDYGGGTNGSPRFSPVWERRDAGPTIPPLVDAFMRNFGVPGLSLAVAEQGGLVYAQGFGVADRDSGEKVTTSSLFRIASLSKPITAVAVMKLSEEGKLRLSDTVFGAEGILGTTYGTQPYGTGVEAVTVQHLLEHASGGWSNQAPDPMYASPELAHPALISQVLDTRPLENAPGDRYAYSNFGYCLLGRVIERVSGQTYEAYVGQHVLGPCGITTMWLAGNGRAERRPGEVTYYDQDRGDPYGIPVSRMDAHGGWLGTPTDLLRFAVRIDGLATPPDLLSAASIGTMTTKSTAARDKKDGDYAKGWVVNDGGTWWHTGLLEGSTSVLVRTAAGYCWTAVINTRKTDPAAPDDRTKSALPALDRLMWDIFERVDAWPARQPL
jgi:CubicO group peptidase (beta-lactamase class C family)